MKAKKKSYEMPKITKLSANKLKNSTCLAKKNSCSWK